jgi:hypothetical protein
MPSQRDLETKSEEGAGRASSIGGPVLAVGAFVAGAAATLVAKRLVDARRKAGRARDELDVGPDGSKDDLATVLRRAALDVAVAASGQAADRLRSHGDEAETKVEPNAEAMKGSRSE